MIVTKADAEALMESVYDAWNVPDIPRMLRHFCDDLVFIEQTGEGGEHYRVYNGSAALGDYLKSYLDVADVPAHIEFLTFDGIYIRTVIAFTMIDRLDGHTYTGTFRQVIQLRGDRISRLETFHDVATATAFWRMLERRGISPSMSD